MQFYGRGGHFVYQSRSIFDDLGHLALVRCERLALRAHIWRQLQECLSCVGYHGKIQTVASKRMGSIRLHVQRRHSLRDLPYSRCKQTGAQYPAIHGRSMTGEGSDGVVKRTSIRAPPNACGDGETSLRISCGTCTWCIQVSFS